VAIDWSAESEILEIKVTDTGVGFDAEAGKKLFQRFVQADASITRRFGGTGLGLAICRGLVDAMCGGMSWSSQPGVGSVFTVRLPAAPEDAPVAKEPVLSQNLDQCETQTIRILAAEDHKTNQKVLSMILEPLGIDLVICENGALAVEAYQTQAFDVVLMDMQMPVMDFEDQSGALRTPIVMLTANAMRQHREAAKEAGADYHVAKPFTPASLLEAIEIALSCEPNADEVVQSDVA
jgi:two-component system, sensor histidine kinase